jgi:hypothetical protein
VQLLGIALGVVLAVRACGAEEIPCPQEACEASGRPQPRGAIETGVVGVASYGSDLCANGCCECKYTMIKLALFEGPSPTIGDGGVIDPLRTIDVVERYAIELAPGQYTLCEQIYTNSVDNCVSLPLREGEVFTVNAANGFGGTNFVIFDSVGTSRQDLSSR